MESNIDSDNLSHFISYIMAVKCHDMVFCGQDITLKWYDMEI